MSALKYVGQRIALRKIDKSPVLSHFDAEGSVRMVDVSGKQSTARRARAQGFVQMSAVVLRQLPRNPKGNPLEIARIAGIAAAKQTSALIPLCHPLPLTHVDVQVRVVRKGKPTGVRIEATAATEAPTGVEMEALTAVSVAALTLYDMCKAVDKSITITDICLLEKSGGKSGVFRRPPSSGAGKLKKATR
ncbi:MAG: cyclic pyranopterin monophosphate synthase MoaC [Acidobacteria bacterium]|nr:cyclic pyranopterin monophosphate synthase MoaC [Acidobacteriota bacterium]